MLNKPKKFLTEVYQELHKVAWPSKTELIGSTAVVIIMSLVVALFIGAVDFILGRIIDTLVKIVGS